MTKVYETNKRSILKSMTGRLIEIVVGTLVQGSILGYLGLPAPYGLGFIMTLVEEALCFVICFANERTWNLTDWGRHVK